MAARWTKEEKELLIKLREQGLSGREIALQLPGRSEATVKNMVAKLCPKNALWTEEEDRILLENRHLSNKEIASLLPHRTPNAVRTRIASTLVSTGQVPSKNTKAFVWTVEKENEVIELYKQGITYKEISSQLGMSFNALTHKIQTLKNAGVIPSRLNSSYWLEEEVAKLCELRSQGESNTKIAQVLGRSLPSVAMQVSKMLKDGRLTEAYTSIRKGKPTCLYLVHFEEEDFYKIGITQQSLETRFLSYPKHTVIEVLTFDTLEIAKEVEQEILKAVKPFKYEPLVFRCGSTECFQCPEVRSITDLVAYAEAWK